MPSRKGNKEMIEIPKTKLDKVVIKKAEGARIALTEPYFTPDVVYNVNGGTDKNEGIGMIIATNGFTMAILPVHHDPEDTEGYLPLGALKDGQKAAKRQCLSLAARSEHVAWQEGENSHTYQRIDLGKPPQLKVCIPHIPEDNRFQVALDVDLLSDLADALCERLDNRRKGSRRVVLTFNTENPFSAFLVEPHATAKEAKDKGRFGVQMPTYVQGHH